MNNLFLTGRIGIGKSTILKKVLNNIDLSIGGYITERIYEGYYRRYIAKSVKNPNEQYTIVRSDSRDNSKIWFPEAFEKGLAPLLDKSLKSDDIIVLDELGSSEKNIDVFTSKIFELLDSQKIVFGVLKDEDCEFLNNIRNRKDVMIIRITEGNRDHIWQEIINTLKSFI
ncbi:nucleoside-triphosphatase [Tepidimicrobium xylanilyticum]